MNFYDCLTDAMDEGSVDRERGERAQRMWQETADTYDISIMLRDKRERWLLTIRELEEVAGLESNHLAKVERNGTKKIPNVQTLVD